MTTVTFLLVFGLLVFSIGIWLFASGEDTVLAGFVAIITGALLVAIVTFMDAPHEIPSGLPLTSINRGEYKVPFVYVAGENVNLGIEKKDSAEENHERIYLYQFPKSAFDGAVNPSAKKLVVVESGGFRKLVLK